MSLSKFIKKPLKAKDVITVVVSKPDAIAAVKVDDDPRVEEAADRDEVPAAGRQVARRLLNDWSEPTGPASTVRP